MEHCDGENSAKRPNLSAAGGSDSEDRLSALPDDVLMHTLLKLLDVAVAARTSVLSSRWRRLWRLLPELNFPFPSDPQHIRLALTAHEAPALHRLSVDFIDATAESVAAWLPMAARRLSGDLLLINTAPHNETEDEAAEGGALELPCFESATSIHLELGYLGLAVPPLGEFAGLTDLFLAFIKLHGPCELGEAVSSLRCPSLQRLTVCDAWGMANFNIHSESLKQLKLIDLHQLQQLTVMTPALVHLCVSSCFSSSHNQPVANISAPKLVSLDWGDHYDPRFTQLGKMENLECLSPYPFLVFGRDESAHELNSSCVSLLQRFELIRSLSLTLIYVPQDIPNKQYLMEDIKRLPDLTHLTLYINPQGHSFGASVFHLLRMCTGVRNLVLKFYSTPHHPEAETLCPSGCVCHQPPNWKTEQLVLNRLQEVEIWNLRATEREAALVKRLFEWETVLQKMTVTFHWSVNKSTANKFWRMLRNFSRPGIRMLGRRVA
ncbi:putative F-box/FBD/LRR-repeat protein At4g03220 [Lolium rigidum]|uniref:putative F-box/FBD/LRR-repeat protein At4g03220 n=1 Tax=Lolium rigidum TaxID=89674 RepID=UPI001F5C6CF5|nr:putative F-box/FBD/LRR-repeat protein At4g03220 [Lolium rigidum]